MKDYTLNEHIKRIEEIINKLTFRNEKFSITEMDNLEELIKLSDDLNTQLEIFKVCWENDKSVTLKPQGFEWTDKNTKDNNWSRGENKDEK